MHRRSASWLLAILALSLLLMAAVSSASTGSGSSITLGVERVRDAGRRRMGRGTTSAESTAETLSGLVTEIQWTSWEEPSPSATASAQSSSRKAATTVGRCSSSCELRRSGTAALSVPTHSWRYARRQSPKPGSAHGTFGRKRRVSAGSASRTPAARILISLSSCDVIAERNAPCFSSL